MPFEASLFKVDKFLKFYEFDKKLPVQTNWLDD